MLPAKDILLFKSVKNLARKLQQKCNLKNVELDELIQVGCMACIEARKNNPNYVLEETAKKAILSFYYKERNIQNKQITSKYIGKNDEKKERSLVEEVLPAKTPLTDAEREEADKQQGLEWDDLPEDLPEEYRKNILAYRDYGVYGYWASWKSTAYRYRRKTIANIQEHIYNNEAGLMEDLRQLLRITPYAYVPFARYIARKLHLDDSDTALVLKIKKSLNCPLIRKQLVKVYPKFEEVSPLQRNKWLEIYNDKQRIDSNRAKQKEWSEQQKTEKKKQRQKKFLHKVYRSFDANGCPYTLLGKYICKETNSFDLPQAKKSLQCPLVRKAFRQIIPDFDVICKKKYNYNLREAQGAMGIKLAPVDQEYQRQYNDNISMRCISHNLKINAVTKKIMRQSCPLMRKVLDNGVLLRTFPNLFRRDRLVKVTKEPNKLEKYNNALINKMEEIKPQYATLTEEELVLVAKDILKKERYQKDRNSGKYQQYMAKRNEKRREEKKLLADVLRKIGKK